MSEAPAAAGEAAVASSAALLRDAVRGLEELLSSGWTLRAEEEEEKGPSAMEHVDRLSAAALAMDLGAVRPRIAHAVRLLRSAGVDLTDRRIVRIQRLIAAAAALAGRAQPTEADLWPIVLALPVGGGRRGRRAPDPGGRGQSRDCSWCIRWHGRVHGGRHRRPARRGSARPG